MSCVQPRTFCCALLGAFGAADSGQISEALSQDAWKMFAFRANRLKKTNEQGNAMRVMGLDPGLRALGWGVVDVSGPRLRHVANGICRTQTGPLGPRLAGLFEELSAIFDRFQPETAAVEQTFVNRDGVGTLKLGQARGIAMLVPARAGIEIGEYAPNAVKKAVVGVGHADKRQVDHMVRMQLPGVELAGPDAADALAIAICHAHMCQSRAVIGGAA